MAENIADNMTTDRPWLLFENTLADNTTEPARLFVRPLREIVATRYDQLDDALAQIDQERQRGHYLAGFITYEAAFAFSPKLTPFIPDAPTDEPLLQFYVFDRVHELSPPETAALFRRFPDSEPFIRHWRLAETEAQYVSNLQQLHRHIERGDVYQVNHTFRANFELEGSISSLYQALRQTQPVAFSAFLQLPQASVLSLSPELFLKKRGNSLTTKPMKGTAARSKDPQQDQQIIAAMREDKKLHSENLMIVDLMRNDLGRIAKPGSVSVSHLFEVQTYKTLHQMISTIQGEIAQKTPFATIIKQLFPCGSITGAPKISSMEIIRQLENTPRGLYTGAIGFITPDNDFTFNVPIRTITFPTDSKTGTVGIGGGIIHESKPADEWQEALLKARFLTGLNDNFRLIEAFRYDSRTNTIPRLKMHLARLANSAAEFGFPVNTGHWQTTIAQLIAQLADQTSVSGVGTSNTLQDYKIRLLLDAAGEITLSSETIPAESTSDQLPQIIVSKQRIEGNNLFRRHKTTRRALYNESYQQAEKNGCYDILFLNEQGYIAETSRHNLIAEIDGQHYTPPVDDGALPGVMRQQLLEDTDFTLVEKRLTLKSLRRADGLYLCNSVRGLVRVELAKHRQILK